MRKPLIGAALSMLFGTSAALAAGTTTNGFDWGTGFISPTSYELSHREQRHGVQTSDGAVHVIINVGTTNNALRLYSSFNGGKDWCATFTFPGTTTGISQTNSTVSTDDVLLVTSGATQLLDVTYDQDSASGGVNALMYSVLTYSTGASCSNGTLTGTPWSYNTGTGIPTYPVTAAGGGTSMTTFQQPTLAIDSSGGVWLSAVEIAAAGATGIKVLYSSSTVGASFTTQAQTFIVPGVTNAMNPNHAPRLFNIPSSLASMGLLFQVSRCLYYTPLTLSGGVITKGTNVELSASYGPGVDSTTKCALPALQSGTQDTAFSISTDSTGNSYLAFVIQDPATGLANGVFTLNFCGTPLAGLTGAPSGSVCGTQTGDAAAGSWVGGQYLNLATFPTGAIYAKTSLVTATISGVTTYYSVVFINNDNGSPGGSTGGQNDNLAEYTSYTFQESPATVNYLGTVTGTTAMNNLVHPQPSVVGGLVHFSSFTPGSGYTNGTYPNVASSDVTGTGTGGKLSLTVAGGSMTSVYPGEATLSSIGSGYAAGNVLTCCAHGTGFTATLGPLTTDGAVTTAAQDYSNSRIEAPQYISVTSTTATMPVWDQYLFDTSNVPPAPAVYDNSIIYWNEVAVPVLN